MAEDAYQDLRTEYRKQRIKGKSNSFFIADILLGFVYVVCGKVGDNPYMTWSQLETLEKQGHNIQDHTMTYPHLIDLSNSELE